MAQRLALIPEELVVGSHHLQKPELRIENDMVQLLDRETLPDDMKVKLLTQLMMRYQKSVHTPPEPVRVTIADEKKEKSNFQGLSEEESQRIGDDDDDYIIRDIFTSSPRNYWKFIPMIIQKLKTRAYSWNDAGEIIANNAVVKNSRMADFFSYLFRNTKAQKEPVHFGVFLQAMKEINIPHYWVGNKRVLENLKSKSSYSSTPDLSITPKQESEDQFTPVSARKKRKKNVRQQNWTPL